MKKQKIVQRAAIEGRPANRTKIAIMVDRFYINCAPFPAPVAAADNQKKERGA